MIEHAPFVLFRDDSEDRTMVFAEPSRVITARTRAEFRRGLSELDAARRAGKWLAGYMAYEAGHLFEAKLTPFAEENRETPLMSFGVFDVSRTSPCSRSRAPAGIFLPIASVSSGSTSTCAREIATRRT